MSTNFLVKPTLPTVANDLQARPLLGTDLWLYVLVRWFALNNPKTSTPDILRIDRRHYNRSRNHRYSQISRCLEQNVVAVPRVRRALEARPTFGHVVGTSNPALIQLFWM